MVRFPFKMWTGTTAVLVILPCLPTPSAFATESRSVSQMNCGAHIECVTPDGQSGRISRLPVQDPTAAALIMDDDTVTCVLQEGETNFVIELPEVAVPDRFTFLNENGKARGELKISVSNQRLAPTSPDWKEVEGVIPFSHKRLFGVSLLGIEAKYVRLSFRVEKATPIAAANRGLTDNSRAALKATAFANSALDEALNSALTAQIRSTPILLSDIVSSVGPLTASD
ncbi:MAG TPA: hypothetical protein VJ719_09905 [Chthoniobacterales bacterium]|nr:hypothetical protein [Chthoniobacterales bacterium]